MDHPHPRVVGVDFGLKRVGLAMADPLRLFAQPVGTYPPDEALEVLSRMHEDEGLEAVIIGWPLTEQGVEGKATRRVQHYIHRLKKRLGAVRIVKWDERYSSEQAKDLIRQQGRGLGKDKGRIDRASAALLLQEFLDHT